MIVVEGPDGAGKTSLIDEMKDRFKHRLRSPVLGYSRQELSKRDIVGRSYRALRIEMDCDAESLIHDRLFFSELVYSKALDRECQFSHIQRDFVLGMLSLMQVPIIICMPPYNAVYDNTRDEPEKVKRALPEIYDKYKGTLDHLRDEGIYNVVHYDYTDVATKEVAIKAISDHFDKRVSRAWR